MDTPDVAAVARSVAADGFAVVPGLVDPEECDVVRAAWLTEGAPHDGPLLRQLTGRLEPHRRGRDGLVRNPIANLHQLPADRFPTLRTAELRVMQGSWLVPIARAVLGTPPAMLQSAYYESADGTAPHVDSHPGDDAGAMLGAWIALEDVHPGASRFYGVPGTHRLPGTPAYDALAAWSRAALRDQHTTGEASPTVSDRAPALFQALLDAVPLAVVTPSLRRGDVVLWDRRTVHGSTAPTEPGRTRHSLVLHFVAQHAPAP